MAEERTKFVGNRPGEGEDGAKSSLSPKKFTHAFDLIVQKTSRSEVVVRKTRYRGWTKDQKLDSYERAFAAGATRAACLAVGRFLAFLRPRTRETRPP